MDMGYVLGEIKVFCDFFEGELAWSHGSGHGDEEIRKNDIENWEDDKSEISMYVGASSAPDCEHARGTKLDVETCMKGLMTTIRSCKFTPALIYLKVIRTKRS